jgi:WD40 repeat protein
VGSNLQSVIQSIQITPRLIEFDTELLRLECVYAGHKNTVTGVIQDKGKLWTASFDYTLKSWELPTKVMTEYT